MVLADKALGIMIELCTKKCMAIFTLLMLIVTIVVLVVENEFSVSHAMRGLAVKVVETHADKQCWLHEKFDIKKECTYCTDFEKKSLTAHCQETGFKMLVQCEKTGKRWKSCTSPKDPYIETRNFWLFESSMVFVGLVSFLVVRSRRKNLDKILMEKINRQIASGV